MNATAFAPITGVSIVVVCTVVDNFVVACVVFMVGPSYIGAVQR